MRFLREYMRRIRLNLSLNSWGKIVVNEYGRQGAIYVQHLNDGCLLQAPR